jgi:hypothetical protein
MNVRTLARRVGAIILVACVGLGAAACSEDSADTAPQGSGEGSDATPHAAEETTAPDTPADAPEELSAEDFFPTVTAALRDAGSFRFGVTTTTAGAVQEAEGVARFTDAGAEIQASSTGAQEVEMILLDQTLYLRSEQLGLGDTWMAVDLREQQNPLFDLIAKATDPRSILEALESPEELELVGTEEVDGATVNRYRITIDSARYAEAMGLPAAMGSFLPDEIVQEMWVDAEGRPVRHRTTVETGGTSAAKATTATTEGFYSDFGLDVEIEAPPASETTQAPALPGAA